MKKRTLGRQQLVVSELGGLSAGAAGDRNTPAGMALLER